MGPGEACVKGLLMTEGARYIENNYRPNCYACGRLAHLTPYRYNSSSYDEEIVAMQMALEWLLLLFRAMAIGIDSQWLLKAI